MENIIIKLAEYSKIPAIAFIIFLIYIISKSSFVSIVNASSIERLFFSHEKKAVFKLFYVFIIFALNTFLMFVATSLLYSLCHKMTISNVIYNNTNYIINASIIMLFSFHFCIAKIPHLEKLYKKIICNEKLAETIVIINFIVLTIIISIWNVISVCKSVKTNQLGYLLIYILINSIACTWISIDTSKTYIRRNRSYYIIDNLDKWFIIKPLDKDTYMLGDNHIEDECIKIKIISKEILLNKEIIIEKKFYNDASVKQEKLILNS